jgi:hypothetical protein
VDAVTVGAAIKRVCLAAAALALAAAVWAPAGGPAGARGLPGGFRGVPELVYGRDGDLWLARADGSERRPLTARNDPALVAIPLSWSPDGRWLAYTLSAIGAYPGDQQLLLLDVLTGEERTLAARSYDPQVVWSADSRRFVVEGVYDPAVWPGDPLPALHVYLLAAARLVHLRVPHAGAGRSVACAGIGHVAPGAEWLAYLAPDGDLRFRHLPSGRERSLGAPPDPRQDLCHFVAWSPDARWFAWTRQREDLRTTVDPGPWAEPPREVYALRVDAAGMQDAVLLGTVTRGLKCCHWHSGYRPLLWSPDALWLDSWFFMPALFPRPDSRGSTAPPAGGWPGLHDCAPGDTTCRARSSNPYHWSPDGAWVLYEASATPSSFPRQGVLRLVRLDSLGGPAQLVVDLVAVTPQTSGFYATYLTSRFSPDGRYVAYLAPDGGLWTYDVADGAHAPLDGFRSDAQGIWSTVPLWRP